MNDAGWISGKHAHKKIDWIVTGGVKVLIFGGIKMLS